MDPNTAYGMTQFISQHSSLKLCGEWTWGNVLHGEVWRGASARKRLDAWMGTQV